MISPFDKTCRTFNAMTNGRIVCPFCHSFEIEPDNVLGLTDMDIGRPIYTVKLDEHGSILIAEENNIPLRAGVHKTICPNCGQFYYLYVNDVVATYRYRSESNILQQHFNNRK